MEACREPQDDDVRMLKLEVDFERPAYMTQDQQHRLLALLSEIVGNPESQPKDGVFWVGEVGSKPSWSAFDAAFLGREVQENAPENGEEPVFDNDIYYVRANTRGFASEDERQQVELERAKEFKPRAISFSCPSCGGHAWGTLNAFDPPEQWKRMCYGYTSKQIGVARAMLPCGFQWEAKDDDKYGVMPVTSPEGVGMVTTAEPATRRAWLELLTDDDFIAVIEMLPSARRHTIGNGLIEGLGDASFEDWRRLREECSTHEMNWRNELSVAQHLRRQYNALPDEPFQNFIERIVDPKYALRLPRLHAQHIHEDPSASVLPCRGCEDEKRLATAAFKPGDKVLFKNGDPMTRLQVIGLDLSWPLENQYLLQVENSLIDGSEKDLERA